MGVGRFVCVAMPLVLTIASIVALLYATLAGVAHNKLFMFSVDVSEMSIDPASVKGIAKDLGVPLMARQDVKLNNITAADLDLADVYEINLWGYCASRDGKRSCTDASFDWASKTLNTSYLEDFGAVAGVKIELPDEIEGALKTFRTVTKFTEIAFIAALVGLGLELIIGIFSNFSRGISCLTWLEACITVVLVFAAAGMSTAMAAIVVGTVKSTAKIYGVGGSINTQWLVTVWIAAAFALASTLFWVFTICCCKPSHGSRKDKVRFRDSSYHNDGEKLLPQRGYAPLNDNHEMTGFHNAKPETQSAQSYQPQAQQYYQPTGYHQPQEYGNDYFGGSQHQQRYPANNGRSDLAYEPYSHRA